MDFAASDCLLAPLDIAATPRRPSESLLPPHFRTRAGHFCQQETCGAECLAPLPRRRRASNRRSCANLSASPSSTVRSPSRDPEHTSCMVTRQCAQIEESGVETSGGYGTPMTATTRHARIAGSRHYRRRCAPSIGGRERMVSIRPSMLARASATPPEYWLRLGFAAMKYRMDGPRVVGRLFHSCARDTRHAIVPFRNCSASLI